jgi:GMP synthase-like glutamine amidotransferase
MKKLKIFLAQKWSEYTSWLENVEIVKNIEDAQIVLFEGGEDVHPLIYGEKQHPSTSPNIDRDLVEIEIYRKALRLNKHIMGICRGSQFICAMQPKGRLVQDQTNRYSHSIETFDGKTLLVNSTHHQAQYPFDMNSDDYEVLAWSENISKHHEDGDSKELNPKKECEIVYYPKARALGIQHHPEGMAYNSEANVWLRNLVNSFINDAL